MKNSPYLLCLTITACLLSTIAWAQTQIGSEIEGDVAHGFFGRSVSMPDANTLAVGAPDYDGAVEDDGYVRVYSWRGSAWHQKGSDIDEEGFFEWSDGLGWSISMPDSNTLAVGAVFDGGNNAFRTGRVRVYSWNGSAWHQKGRNIDGEGHSDWSGSSVSMPDSNTLAIGAFRNDGNGSDAGHVRVYGWNGSAWHQKGIDIDWRSS